MKKDDTYGTDIKQALDKIQKQLDAQRQAGVKTIDTQKVEEEAKRRAEIERQLEAERLKKEHRRIQTRQLAIAAIFIVAVIVGIVFQQYIKKVAMSDSDFMKLCESGDAKKVEEAIVNGANVNAKDNTGKTALMLATATWKSRIEVAEVLLKHGANVNNRNKNGHTALMGAVNAEIAELKKSNDFKLYVDDSLKQQYRQMMKEILYLLIIQL